jgi:hypothetical protein
MPAGPRERGLLNKRMLVAKSTQGGDLLGCGLFCHITSLTKRPKYEWMERSLLFGALKLIGFLGYGGYLSINWMWRLSLHYLEVVVISPYLLQPMDLSIY